MRPGAALPERRRRARGHRARRSNTLLWFDVFGLALVTVAGTAKALDVAAPALVAIAFLVIFGVPGLAIRCGWWPPIFRAAAQREPWHRDRRG